MIDSLPTDEAEEIALGYDGYVASQEVSQHRWYTERLIVFKRDHELFGFYYFDPATEMQEDQDRFDSDPVRVFPVVAREQTILVYEELV